MVRYILSPQITLSQNNQEMERQVVLADGANLPMPEKIFLLLSFLTEPRSFQEIEEMFVQQVGHKPNTSVLEAVLQDLSQKDKFVLEVE